MSSNVILIDPNNVNINSNSENIVNGIPQYQDMHIFAELIAKSKGRTVKIINKETTSTDSETVNFIGNNQDINNPNNLNFTTNYYDGSTGNGRQYEGFGINNIKIKLNSSFIPQIDIQFVDVRGLAFFNQTDSPYRILFDFPPPIFTLTVKGYYGKPITYKLHLVKYTSEFNSSNGNFIVDAQFVAVTFAPLSDILFRYIVNMPLIEDNNSMSPDTKGRPTNTFNLILKLKNLYTTIANNLETDVENEEYRTVLKQIEKIDDVGTILNSILKKENDLLNSQGRPLLIAKTPNDEPTGSYDQYNLKIIKTLSEFNKIIETEQTTGKKNIISNRLFIAYKIGNNLPFNENEYNPFSNSSTYVEPIIDPYEYNTKNYNGFKNVLNSFTQTLMNNILPSFGITTNDISTPESFINYNDVVTSEKNKTEYYGMDITDYYYKLYKKNFELNLDKNELSTNLATKINNMVIENLGMKPTIYNIFDIILDDVDDFFSILRKTSDEADEEHNKTKDIIRIIADNNIDTPVINDDIPSHIYPFPLIIDESPVYGGTKQERVAPIKLSEKVSFPELDLVSDFMDTFLLQKKVTRQYDARANQEDDGSYKWIPVSPYDSVLGGVSPESPYLNINNNFSAEMTEILLKRFYILSQGSINNSFYDTDKNKRNAYIELYATAEAVNIISTLGSELNANNLEEFAKKYTNNINDFYEYAKTINTDYDDGSATPATGNLIDFPENNPKSFTVTPSKPNTGKVYVDKYNSNFSGINWYLNDVVIQNTDEIKDSNKPIDKFSSTAKDTFFRRLFFGDNAESLYYEFTQENVIFLSDNDTEKRDNNIINGISMYTRYLTGKGREYWDEYTYNGFNNTNENNVNDKFPGANSFEAQKIAYQEGNESFNQLFSPRDKQLLKRGDNIFNVWSDQLAYPDIVNALTGGTNLSQLLILSNFGKTASPFNNYPNGLNELIFDTPAAIEVPYFYLPYLGALLTAIDNKNNGDVDNILNFFTGTTGYDGSGRTCPNTGFFILADLHDVDKYLSENDKQKCKIAYEDYNNEHQTIVSLITEMVNYVRKNTGEIFDDEQIGYMYLLNEESDSIKGAVGHGQYFYIIETLMERKTLVNFSQITFEMTESFPDGYTSIEDLNNNTLNNSVNQRFFQTFFSEILSRIKKKKKELKEEKEELTRAKGDKDVINQLYYSFKNINDKWLTGKSNDNDGYPYNKPDKKLINSFAFVDRAMNPIGDTVINAEILIDMFDDPNISLFSVLSQLLSLNGFEFFPLQNFLSFNNQGWEDSFKIYSGAIADDPSSAFVCMYIGGTSSYPSITGNGFVNDGIIDISEPGVRDYSIPKPNQEKINELKRRDEDSLTEDEKQLINDDFPWQEVRAFKVRFGEQNQSMFTDIKIDSKEYTDTNESIQILSRLAGDENPNAQVPKGQNLYNLYENRSYKATVKGFGNAMIQPTQYFQLENIPLFNGAYIILDVEHVITANKMETSFSGTKILKYPVPRVLNPMAFTNYNPNQSIGNLVTDAINYLNVSNREETHYNSMYDNTDNSLKL